MSSGSKSRKNRSSDAVPSNEKRTSAPQPPSSVITKECGPSSVTSVPSTVTQESGTTITSPSRPRQPFLASPSASWSSPTKTAQQTIIGYVHCLSPPKRNKKDTMNYSTLMLQTSDDGPPKDALLYSKHKRPLLKNSEDCHTPVKIQHFTYTDDGSNKVIINDKTQISVPDQTEYCFQYKEMQTPEVMCTAVAEILQSSNEWDLVKFCGKAVHVGEASVVSKKLLKLVEATFADGTGTISVDLWEQHIDMVKCGKVYSISPVQVRIWNDKKKLSTTRNSVITEVMDDPTLEAVSISQEEMKSHCPLVTLEVPCIHSIESVEPFISCVNCSRKLLQPNSKVVHCDRCGYTMRVSNCVNQLCAKIVVHNNSTENDVLHLTAFQDILEAVVQGTISSLSHTEVAEQLLLLDNLSITYNRESLVIKDIQFG